MYLLSYKNITEKPQFSSVADSRSDSTLFSKCPWWLLRFAKLSSHFANLIVISHLFIFYFLPYRVLRVTAFSV